MVYVFPASPRNGTAQFEVAVKLNRSPKALGNLRMTVTTVKGTVLAVDDLNARSFGRASRYCVLSRTLYDDTGKRRPQPGGLVRVQIDFSRGTKAHRVTRTARSYRATEANSGSDGAFQRVAARSLGC